MMMTLGLGHERWVTLSEQFSFGSPPVCKSMLPLVSVIMHFGENTRSWFLFFFGPGQVYH